MKHYNQHDFQQVPIQGLVVESVAAAPSSPVNGRVYYDTVLNQFLARINGAWVDLGINTTYTTGTAAQITTGTDTTSQVWKASDLKTAINSLITTAGATGAAGGDLQGTYPNPTIKNLAVTNGKIADTAVGGTKIAADIIPLGDVSLLATGTAAAAALALRKLGFGANDALAGTTRLDQMAAPTTQLSIGNNRIINLLDPTGPQDGATKSYVDNSIQGIKGKSSVRLATTANVALTGLQTIDGVAGAANDRVLVKNQTAPAENGLYQMNSGAWTRVADADAWGELVAAFVFVEEGTTLKDTGWLSTSDRVGTLGTTAIPFVQFSSAGVVTASGGLQKVGNDISIANDGIVRAMILDGEVVESKLSSAFPVQLNGSKVGGTLPVNRGGTGAGSVAGARAFLQTVGRLRITSPALVAGVWSADLVHNFNGGTENVSFVEVATGENVDLDWRRGAGGGAAGTDTLSIQVRSAIAATAGSFLIMVHGGDL